MDISQSFGSRVLFVFFSAAAVSVVGFVGFPLVHGDLAEDLAAVESVVREPFLPVKVCEVRHGFVGKGRQRGSFQRRYNIRADVPEVSLFVGEESELSDACAYADEGTYVFGESSVSLEDIVESFFAGIVTAKPAIFESHGWERYASVSWQDPDWTEVRWCGRSRSGHFMQRC